MNGECYFCKEAQGTTFAYSGTNCVMVCDKCAEKIAEISRKRKEEEKNASAGIFNKRHAR